MNEKSTNKLQEKYENLVETGSTSSNIEEASFLSAIKFPIVRRVFSQTLGGPSKVEKEAIESRIKAENRDAKIDAVVDGKPFIEKKLEDDPEYKEIVKNSLVSVKPMSAPSGSLMYLDYIYDKKEK